MMAANLSLKNNIWPMFYMQIYEKNKAGWILINTFNFSCS